MATCKYCGDTFTANKRGKKREYCNKAECINKAKNEAQRKWYAKKMEALKGTKYRITDKEGKKIVYSSTDRAMNNLQNEDFTDVIELARELGAVKFKITEAIKKCQPEQSAADRDKEVFVHKIENLARQEKVSNTEIVDIVVEYIDKLQNRRNIKDKMEMLGHLTQGYVQNPTAYVAAFIKGRDSRKYNPNKQGGKTK